MIFMTVDVRQVTGKEAEICWHCYKCNGEIESKTSLFLYFSSVVFYTNCRTNNRYFSKSTLEYVFKFGDIISYLSVGKHF